MLEPRKSAGTIEKALDVLFHLHAAGAALGVSELGKALRLPKSSAHRLLAALVRRGLVERDGDARYRPGMALVALGLGVLEREPVVLAARPVLEAEARALGDTLFLTAARAGAITVLDKVEGTGFLRASPHVGGTVPVHATAVGRLQLAFDPDSVAPQSGPLARYTEHTPTRRAELDRLVAEARRRGWDENREEWTPGLVVVAAPVLVAGRLVATVAVGAPAARLPASRSPAVALRLKNAAARIGARLAGSAAEHRR